jgi:trans-aconitate methyltransferase
MKDLVSDHFYLNESSVGKTKEYFEYVLAKISQHLPPAGYFAAIDVGCAAGDFIRRAKEVLPPTDSRRVNWHGADVSEEMLTAARIGNEECPFYQFDLRKQCLPGCFDLMTLFGTLEYSEDPGVLRGLVKSLRPGGVLHVITPLNPDPVDVVVKSTAPDRSWEKTYYLHSVKTVVAVCRDVGASVNVSEWVCSLDIPRREDPLRSWSVSVDGKRVAVNGCSVLKYMFHVEVVA